MIYRNKQTLLRTVFFLVAACWTTSLTFAFAASSQRTVLVTGGAGYIGSHTCLELLEQPDNLYRVVVVDNLDNSSEDSLRRVRRLTSCDKDRLVFRQCDIRDRKGLEEVLSKPWGNLWPSR
jgi:FlaA1/EpsC-like NDP-sugar epimerase